MRYPDFLVDLLSRRPAPGTPDQLEPTPCVSWYHPRCPPLASRVRTIVPFDPPVSPWLTGDLALLCSTAGCGSQALQFDRGPTGGTTGPPIQYSGHWCSYAAPGQPMSNRRGRSYPCLQRLLVSLYQPRISAAFRGIPQGRGGSCVGPFDRTPLRRQAPRSTSVWRGAVHAPARRPDRSEAGVIGRIRELRSYSSSL